MLITQKENLRIKTTSSRNRLPKSLFVLSCFSFYSCATLFTGTKDKITIDSFPQGATVKVNDNYVGETPLQLKVKRTVFHKQIVGLSKDGFQPLNYHLTRELNLASLLSQVYIPIDVLTGAVILYEPRYYNSRLIPADSSGQNGSNVFNGGKDLHIWNNKVRLNWDFFRGKPEKHSTDKFLKTGAVCSSYITYSYSNHDSTVTLSSFAVFNTIRSWVKFRSKDVLNHEQRHFDLTEIYSRKFKKKLLTYDYSGKNFENIIKSVYNEYKEKLSQVQHNYDEETGHGINKANQEAWDIMIDRELKETSEFSNPSFRIDLRK